MWFTLFLLTGILVVLVHPYLISRQFLLGRGKKGWNVFRSNANSEFLSNAEGLIQEGFSKSSSPFHLMTNDGPRLVLSREHLFAMSDDSKFNAIEAFKQEFLVDLFGFETAFTGDLHNDILAPTVKALTRKLVSLVGPLSNETSVGLEKEWSDNTDLHEIPLQESLAAVVARMASLAFVGPELCRDPVWLDIMISYTMERIFAVNAVRMFPQFLHAIVHWFLSPCRKLRARIKQARRLILPVLERERLNSSAKRDSDRPFSTLAWNDEYADGRRYDPTVAQLRLIFVAMSTTIDMTVKVLARLCEHRELIQPLRDEVVAICGENGLSHTTMDRLLLMDSVMKEIQRLEPTTIASISRLTIQKSILSDGTVVPKGTHVVIPNTFMRNEGVYASSDDFDPYRFLRMRDDPEQANWAPFTRTSQIHTGFGHGKHSCPGRFFATDIIKILLCHILLKYDFQSVNGSPAIQYYGFAQFRDPTARIRVRRRPEEPTGKLLAVS